MALNLKSRYRHVVTDLHPKANDAYRILRADCERRVGETIQEKKPIDKLTLSMLKTFPEIASNLAAGILKQENMGNLMDSNPDIAYYALLGEYRLCAEKFEPLVVGEGQGELIYRLLRWARMTKCELRQPITYYEDWLARDPYWAGQWINYTAGNAELAQKIAVFAQTAREEDAGAAYAWLIMHPEEKCLNYARVLLGNPFYLMLALLSLKPAPDTTLLLKQILTPRWAYHLAIMNTGVPVSLLEEVLVTDIGWLVEYLVDAKISETDTRRVAALYIRAAKQCVEDAQPHACLNAMHAWVNRLTAYHNRKNAAAAAEDSKKSTLSQQNA